MYVRGKFYLFYNFLISLFESNFLFLIPIEMETDTMCIVLNPITQLICLTIEDVCCSWFDFKNICPWFRFWLWWILTVNRYQRIISQANIWYTSSSGGPTTITNIWYTAPGLLLSQLSTMFCHQDIKECIFFYLIFLRESINPNVYCPRTNANVLAQSF